jgi:type I restriction enzyme S subunit
MSKAAMKRYDAYKDSGLEWLGEVPEHWTILRVKDTVIKIGNGVTPKGGSEVYTDVGIPFIRSQNVYDDGLHIEDISFISDEIHCDMKVSQLKEDDILINITGASIGRTCVVPIELGIANINQHVAFLRTKYWFNTTYISLFLKSPFIKKYIQFEQNGASKEAFNLTQIANIPIVLPNVEEQTVISAYLDTKIVQIDRKIDLLTQKATQYSKLKQSLINETVTRGLDKTVAMKDSGVEWIGEVPEHWGVTRIKDITIVKRGASPRPIDDPIYFDEEGEFSWVRISDLSASERYLLGTKEKLSKLGSMLSVKRYPGDLILSIAGTVGKPIITKIKCCIHDGFVWFPNLKVNPEFLYYCFSTGLPYQGLGKLGTQLNLNTETVGLISLPMPSDEELNNIICYLDTKTAHVDRIIETINTQIEKLKELRKTLINDVVTGKIKVA